MSKYDLVDSYDILDKSPYFLNGKFVWNERPSLLVKGLGAEAITINHQNLTNMVGQGILTFFRHKLTNKTKLILCKFPTAMEARRYFNRVLANKVYVPDGNPLQLGANKNVPLKNTKSKVMINWINYDEIYWDPEDKEIVSLIYLQTFDQKFVKNIKHFLQLMRRNFLVPIKESNVDLKVTKVDDTAFCLKSSHEMLTTQFYTYLKRISIEKPSLGVCVTRKETFCKK